MKAIGTLLGVITIVFAVAQEQSVKKCKRSKWECENGNCIEYDQKCNGKFDCEDGSDETSLVCSNIVCPPSIGFQCAYGACLNKFVECNGIQDCIDNSDEMTPNCSQSTLQQQQFTKNCTKFEFKCSSGECITRDLVCDGSIDCQNGSDETVDQCQSTYCPSFGFRCAYGACISAFRKCDNRRDCADGSDETVALCGVSSEPSDNHVETSPPSTGNESCRLDYIPQYGRVVYTGNLKKIIQLGESVPHFKAVTYNCNSDHTLLGSKTNICSNGKWINPLPECTVFCSAIKVTGISIQTVCSYNGSNINCDGPLLEGTIAKISCRFGYSKISVDPEQILSCKKNGEWSDQVSLCIEICGELHNNNSVSPWHVGIFTNAINRDKYSFICSGTMLNAKMIITAANCFWDPSINTFVDASNFVIGLGKVFKDYYSKEPNEPQFLNVIKIVTKEQYEDRIKLYYSDIAIVIVEGFITFTPFIRPICFEGSLQNFERDIPINAIGLVSTFDNESRLQTIEYTKAVNPTCRQSLTPEIRQFLIADKYCSLRTRKYFSVCKDDNGAGMIYMQDDKRYYLKGQSTKQRKCKISQWECKNGQCIQFEEQCNGIVECDDGSDETTEACIYVKCPPFSFRCAYGACVNKISECDGVKDCADNSDEITLNCPGVLDNIKHKGDCSNFQFKCKSGECITEDLVCNGAIDCRDHSDETVEQCVASYCPSIGFRCGYGACISNFRKCDGIIDCRDGSDEAAKLCGYRNSTSMIPTSVEVPVTPTIIKPTSAPENPSIFPEDKDESCILSAVPKYGKAVRQENQNAEVYIGDSVASFQGVQFKCNDESKPIPDDPYTCIQGEWIGKIPECRKYCSGLTLVHPTIRTTCEYKSRPILCGEILNPGTIATIRCEFGYEKPKSPIKEQIFCKDDGTWDYLPFRCEQSCGTPPEKAVLYGFGGTVTNISEVPWHVGIYDRIQIRDVYTQICGGTIITSRLVISAAHCVWDSTNKVVFNESYYKVAVGKFFRNLTVNDGDLQAQVISVKKIFTQPNYNHADGLYIADISMFLLEDFIIFKFYIKPICLEFNTTAELQIEPDTRGIVAGWGVEETGLPSEKLKSLEVPFVDYATCKSSASVGYWRFIVSDKFCGGYLNQRLSVCRGDSGGGWVYPKQDLNGDLKYFLRGIVSNGEEKDGSCDPNKFTAFTSVEFYFSWILELAEKYSPNMIKVNLK